MELDRDEIAAARAPILIALSGALGAQDGGASKSEIQALLGKLPDADSGLTTGEVARVPARDLLSAGIELFGVPTEATTATLAAMACTGIGVSAARVSEIRRSERRAWERAPDRLEPFIAPAIHFDELRPLATTLTSSTWPLETRVIGPLSPRCNFLRSAIRVGERMKWARENSDLVSQQLEPLAWRFARGVPGLASSGRIDPEQLVVNAQRELELSDERDLQDRTAAARRLKAEPDLVQLFGRRDGDFT